MILISTYQSTKKTKTAILKAINNSTVTVSTLIRYVSEAAKLCLLAGGGKLRFFSSPPSISNGLQPLFFFSL